MTIDASDRSSPLTLLHSPAHTPLGIRAVLRKQVDSQHVIAAVEQYCHRDVH